MPSYEERLRHFKMSKLSDRRKLLDLMFLYNVANNRVDYPSLISKISFRAPFKLRRPSAYSLFSLKFKQLSKSNV
ncbi:unnamed protein product [Chilo suppressalis]|uniref:Uncharacterized protein n=1 Tax=Chilo suppressalis TaxID=168631 RepID=A0ABN8B0G4_CHISP|nr:unnamed protein product [Chilo suppressalis]